MRLLTNPISEAFLSKTADFLVMLGIIWEDIGSLSKIGFPGPVIRDCAMQLSNPRLHTTQLIIIALAGFNVEEDGAVQQQVYHDALARLPQQLEELRPWCLFYGGDALVKIETKQPLNGRVRCLLSMADALSKAIAEQMVGPVTWVGLPRKQQPDDEVNNLPSSVSLNRSMSSVAWPRGP